MLVGVPKEIKVHSLGVHRKRMAIFCLFGIVAFGLIIKPANAALTVEQQQWLTCDGDSDCTSVEGGCYYWQPVNKQHAKDMERAIDIDCLASTIPGPQPTSLCKNHVCENGPVSPEEIEKFKKSFKPL